MTIPETPDPDVPVSEVPDPVEATAPKAEPAPDEKEHDETDQAPIGVPATTTPVPPVPPLGSGH